MSETLTFNNYQKAAYQTAIYPRKGSNPYYPVLGLCGESGEVAEKMKKVMRDDNEIITADKKELICKELGDVLWYVAALATELNLSLEDVAQGNLDKLNDRKDRGVIQGSGDVR